MNSNVQERRRQMLDLLEETRAETRSVLSSLDPEQVVHTDERAWRVREVLGHLGVWNGEAASSLEAHATGAEYHCVPSEQSYDDYNGAAVEERRTWTINEVWAEYEQSHDRLRSIVEKMPADRWDGSILYPWNEAGTVEGLVTIMMRHEREDHCEIILKAAGRKDRFRSNDASRAPAEWNG